MTNVTYQLQKTQASTKVHFIAQFNQTFSTPSKGDNWIDDENRKQLLKNSCFKLIRAVKYLSKLSLAKKSALLGNVVPGFTIFILVSFSFFLHHPFWYRA